MFIAATVYGFAKVNRMYDNLSYPQGFLSNITLRFCVKFLKTFGCKKSAKRIEDKARAREHEKRYLQVRGLLARAGFNDAEIDSFFKKYGIKWDKPIDPAIVERMTEDTKGDKSDLDVKKHQELIAQLNQ
ncbi:hypothetical protein AAG570_003900 [Ranatra chinensis]|uniref:Uncharacterized protein n=1 Tax=Ranatra chinensis TaxID=642074 RepID=A0ABD0Y3L2_9HEMI